MQKLQNQTSARPGSNQFGFLGEAAFTRPERLALPTSWWGHVPFAFWIIANLAPRSIAELGVHTGTSYCAFCQAVVQNQLSSKVIGVDTWQGDDHAGRYGSHIFKELSAYHDPKYGSFSTLVRKTFDDALKDVAPGSVDLLHIDGLHTYEAVKHDFDTWLPKMSERGVILFHDTVVREDGFGVWKLWEEITRLYPHFEFRHCNGLGVLGVGSQLPEPLAKLFDPELPVAEAESIRSAFDIIGSSLIDHYRATRFDRYSPIPFLLKVRNMFR